MREGATIRNHTCVLQIRLPAETEIIELLGGGSGVVCQKEVFDPMGTFIAGAVLCPDGRV